MSSLVEESLCVSGILLGKTMGRSPELAERFTRESAELADLEVRSRDGRPLADGDRADELRDHARARLLVRRPDDRPGGAAITIGTLVAFTTLQTRLFFPMQSLLTVGIDIQTSLALFDRIFEYLDLPVDIAERDDARRARATCAARCASRTSSFGYDDDAPPTLDDVDLVVPPGTHDGDRGRDRLGQDDARLPRRAPVRRDGRARDDRRRRRARPDVRVARAHRRARLAGDLPLPRHDRARTCASPGPTRPTRSSRTAARAAQHPRPHRLAARRLRHRRRRARLPLLRRREAAHRDRPHDPAQPAGARARRGDERAGQRDRARRAGGARPPRRGPHDDRHRPPPVDRPRRRPDRRARPRPDRRARHPRRAARPRRPLRDARRARRRARRPT